MADAIRPEPAPQPDDAKLIQRFLVSPGVRRLSESSRRDKRHVLHQVRRRTGRDLAAIATPDLECWLQAGAYSDETRTTLLSHLNGFYSWAEDKGHVEVNPVTPLRCHRRTLADHLSGEAGQDLRQLAGFYVRGRLHRGEITEGTARNVICALENFVAVIGPELAAQDLEQEHVEEWLATRSHLAPATRRKQLSDVKGFCGWLARRRYVAVDPSAEIARVRIPRYIPRALASPSVRDLLQAAPDARGRLIVMFMVEEGLRCAEVAGIELHDINFHDRSLRVTGKGGHERILPITDDTWTALHAYLADRPATSGPLIRSHRQAWSGLRPDSVSRLVADWMSEARVKRRPRDGVSAQRPTPHVSDRHASLWSASPRRSSGARPLFAQYDPAIPSDRGTRSQGSHGWKDLRVMAESDTDDGLEVDRGGGHRRWSSRRNSTSASPHLPGHGQRRDRRSSLGASLRPPRRPPCHRRLYKGHGEAAHGGGGLCGLLLMLGSGHHCSEAAADLRGENV